MANKTQHVLVIASTFPANDADPVPAFVKDQIIALKNNYSDMEFSVLAPHDARSKTKSFVRHDKYDEYRFHYAWPHRLEKLAGRGIVPTLKQNKAYYLLIPFLIAAEYFALRKLTKKIKPDLLYAHWFTPQGITAGLVSAATGTPYVYTSHSSDVQVLRMFSLIGTYIVKRYTRRAKAVTVVSRRSLEKLKSFFNAGDWENVSKKVSIIPMGVSLNKSLVKAEKASDTQNVLFLGRLAEKKGVHYLLLAWKRINSQLPNLKLTIAGDGPWLEKLKEQAAILGLSTTVKFTGYITGQAKQDLINASDIYIVPSIITEDGDAEGLPVALMEGLMAGKICIATNESGADDIIENKVDGFLIPQKDVTAIEKSLISATKLNHDERLNMETKARETAQQFAWPSIAMRHKDKLFTHV